MEAAVCFKYSDTVDVAAADRVRYTDGNSTTMNSADSERKV